MNYIYTGITILFSLFIHWTFIFFLLILFIESKLHIIKEFKGRKSFNKIILAKLNYDSPFFTAKSLNISTSGIYLTFKESDNMLFNLKIKDKIILRIPFDNGEYVLVEGAVARISLSNRGQYTPGIGIRFINVKTEDKRKMNEKKSLAMLLSKS